jgi:hypothetical protein
MAQAPTDLFEGPIRFLMIALMTGRHDVLPSMRTTAAAWLHMVNRGGWSSAVNTLATIAREDRSARKWDGMTVRNTYKFMEPDHGRQDDFTT